MAAKSLPKSGLATSVAAAALLLGSLLGSSAAQAQATPNLTDVGTLYGPEWMQCWKNTSAGYVAKSCSINEIFAFLEAGNHIYSGPQTFSGGISTTAISGMTTPLSVGQGGSGTNSHTAHGILLGEGSSGVATTAAPTGGQLLIGQGVGVDPAPMSVSGDCALSAAGVLICTKTNGLTLVASATTDTTNASNIGSGTLADARLQSDVALTDVAKSWTANQSFQGVTNFGTIGNFYAQSNGTTNQINWAPNVYTQWDTSVSKFAINTAAGKSVTIDASANVVTPGTVTASGGVSTPSISGMTTPLSVAQGGSGIGTLTSHAVVISEGTSAFHATGTMAAGQVLVGQGATADPGVVTLSGDATLAATGALTVTKTNGTAFAASATTDTTIASNITSGLLNNARLNSDVALTDSVKVWSSNQTFQGTTSFGTSGSFYAQTNVLDPWLSFAPGVAITAAHGGGSLTFWTTYGSGKSVALDAAGDLTATGQANFQGGYAAADIGKIFNGRDIISPMDFGCAGDGITDDTSCFQSAYTAASGKLLWLGNHKYKISSSLTHPSGAVAVVGLGSGWNSVASADNLSSCLVAGAANVKFFTVNTGDRLENFCILAGGIAALNGNVQGYITAGSSQLNVTSVASGAVIQQGDILSSATTGLPANLTIGTLVSGTAGGVGVYNLSATVASAFGSSGSPANLSVSLPNTSGNFAIGFSGPTASANVNHLWIDHPCSGVDFNGQLNHVADIHVQNFFGSGCIGFTHGRLTTNGTSNDNFISNWLAISDRTNPGDAGFAIYDAGGSMMSHLDTIYAVNGLKILAGGGSTAASQVVQFVDINDSTMADTTTSTGVTIDTVGSTNMVKGISFNNDWASSAVSGDEITLNNTGAGTVTDTTFKGLRTYGVTAGNGITIGSGVLNTVISSASEICGYNSGYVGVDLKSGVTYVDITSSKIAPTCGGKTSATGQTAIKFEGSNDELTIVGDNFYGNGGQTIFTGSGLNGATHAVFLNNLPIDNNTATLTTVTSNSVDFTQAGTVGNYYNSYFISANGSTINAFTNLGASGRTIRLQATGTTTFTIGGGTNAAGSIANPAITVNPFQSVWCFYGGTYLACH